MWFASECMPGIRCLREFSTSPAAALVSNVGLVARAYVRFRTPVSLVPFTFPLFGRGARLNGDGCASPTDGSGCVTFLFISYTVVKGIVCLNLHFIRSSYEDEEKSWLPHLKTMEDKKIYDFIIIIGCLYPETEFY